MAAESEHTVRRVLMTADTVGGVWTYSLELTRALGMYGIEVVLATMGRPLDAVQKVDSERLDNLTIFESGYRLEWMEDPWEDVEAAGDWLLDLERRVNPDIVHLNGYAHGALPWKSPLLMVGHSCVYSWHGAVKGSPPAASWERYRREVIRGLRAAGMVTAPSRSMLEMLRRQYGSFRAAAPIYNGRNPEVFSPGSKEPVIMAAGRVWDEAKNLRMLGTVSRNLPWPVMAAGECTHPDGRTVTLDGVECLGSLPSSDLAGWLGKASIFALPARYEPFGFTALEAGLAGCALVLGDIPSLREIWNGNALFVPPNRADLLEETLRRLIENEALRILLGRRARARALEFTPERMGGEYLRLYGALLHRSEGSSVRGEDKSGIYGLDPD